MLGNEEILPALSRERECGKGCFFREMVSSLKSHLNKDLHGIIWLPGEEEAEHMECLRHCWSSWKGLKAMWPGLSE